MNDVDSGRRYRVTHHNGSNWYKRIVHPSSFINVACLKRYLETAAAHSETHGVHIDMIRESSTVLSLCN